MIYDDLGTRTEAGAGAAVAERAHEWSMGLKSGAFTMLALLPVARIRNKP